MTNARQSYDERKKPVVPEPGAYGAGLMALLILAVVVIRLTRSRWRGPAD